MKRGDWKRGREKRKRGRERGGGEAGGSVPAQKGDDKSYVLTPSKVEGFKMEHHLKILESTSSELHQ